MIKWFFKMKKSYLSLVLLIFILAGVAKLQAQTKEMYFTAFFSPSMSYHFTNIPKNAIQKKAPSEMPNFSFSIGAGLGVQINSFLSFEARVAYSEWSYKTQKTNTHYPTMLAGLIPADYNEVYRFRMIELPLALNFDAGNGDVQFTGAVGVSPVYVLNYLETQKYYLRNSEVDEKRLLRNDFNSQFNLFVSFAAGFKHKINENLSYKFLPEFRVATIKTNVGVETNQAYQKDRTMWNLGFNLVINYKINVL